MWKLALVTVLFVLVQPGTQSYPNNYQYTSPQNAVYDDYRNYLLKATEKLNGMQEYDQLRRAALEALIGMGFERIRKSDKDGPCEGKNKLSEPRCMVRRTLNSLVLGGSFKRSDPKSAKNSEFYEDDGEKTDSRQPI